jgi:hypothetical protein
LASGAVFECDQIGKRAACGRFDDSCIEKLGLALEYAGLTEKSLLAKTPARRLSIGVHRALGFSFKVVCFFLGNPGEFCKLLQSHAPSQVIDRELIRIASSCFLALRELPKGIRVHEPVQLGDSAPERSVHQ